MLVALEGIDGSGKSTVLRRVAARLRRAGHRVVATQEPTKGWLGRAVRASIRARVDPLALAFLFLADRAHHVDEVIRRSGSAIVLTDRYVDSTTAYQAAALDGRVPNPVAWLSQVQDRWFPRADLVILLDLAPATAVKRLAGRAVREPFEKARFLTAVRRNYRTLARRRKFVTVDATLPVDDVVDRIVGVIERRAKRGPRR